MASTPILIETSKELKAHMEVIAGYINKTTRVTLYGEDISSTHIAQMGVMYLARDIKAGLITPEIIAQLEEYYRDYRGGDDKINTNVYFKKADMDDLNVVVAYLDKTGVRHLYHGKSVNKKMVVMFGLRYAYLLATQDQQG